MTSADVVASFDRYAKVGLYRSTLGNVDRWEAPDKDTFVITLKKVQPTFLEILSSFSAPIVIIPAENKDDPPMQLKTIGTGPWQLVESVPGGYVKMKRYDGYKPNTNFDQKTGFGGYKQACFDTVTFRIVTEPQARVAGLKTGELQGVEDLPTKSLADLKADKNITIIPLQNWWIQIAQPNVSVPPTDNLMFRKAVQAVLDMDEIMDAASDGNYRLNVGFQYPNQAFYSDAGQGDLQHQEPRAGEEVPCAVGLQGRAGHPAHRQGLPGDVQLVAGDAAGDAGDRHQRSAEGGGLADLGEHGAEAGHRLEPLLHRMGHAARARCAGDHAVLRACPARSTCRRAARTIRNCWRRGTTMNSLPTLEGRKEAFARMQKYALEQVYTLPLGSLTKVQAVRSNVKGYVPYRIPRMSNVWFEN